MEVAGEGGHFEDVGGVEVEVCEMGGSRRYCDFCLAEFSVICWLKGNGVPDDAVDFGATRVWVWSLCCSRSPDPVQVFSLLY